MIDDLNDREASERVGHNELNLTTHRDPTSVWDRRGWNGSAETTPVVRLLLGVGGGVLALQGLRRRSVAGSLMVGVGSTLAWWALTGRRNVPEIQSIVERVRERFSGRPDLVHESSAESFPASDAPSWTPATGTGLRRTPDVH